MFIQAAQTAEITSKLKAALPVHKFRRQKLHKKKKRLVPKIQNNSDWKQIGTLKEKAMLNDTKNIKKKRPAFWGLQWWRVPVLR